MQPLSNENAALLDNISQNCAMGKSAIKQLLPHIRDEQFRQTIESQYREYDEIDDLAVQALKHHGRSAEDVSAMAKLSSYLMVNAGTLADGSVSHMAEMMAKGSSNGIIEITKRLNELNDANPEVSALAKRLLSTEQRNMDELKTFL